MWAGEFEEFTGAAPVKAYQCDGAGYSVIFVEFANTSDCLIAEKTITVNLEGEYKVIEGEEVFCEIFWSSSERQKHGR